MRNDPRQYARALVEGFEGISEKKAKEKAERFKKIVYKHGAAKRIGEILMKFTELWRERKGPIASVVSATPLSSKTKTRMGKILKSKKYVMKEEVNPSVIGGVAMFLGNEYLIDGTFKGKLRRLQRMIDLRESYLDKVKN